MKIILKSVVLLMVLILSNGIVFGKHLEFNPMEVILLLDVSKSMNESDPERLAFEAMNLLVDLVENEQAKVKIVTFAGKIHEETEFYTLYSTDEKELLKKELKKIITMKAATDIGNAVEFAVNAFNEVADKDSQRLIILLSDGKTEVGDATNKSLDRLKSALEKASSDNINIHTIGLNKSKNVNANELWKISETTNGQSFIIDDQSQLPSAITKIYAQHSGNSTRELANIIADGTLQTVKFSIPDTGVLSAHIILTSSNAINQIELLNKNGEVVPFDDLNYTLTQTNFYSFIKILNPDDFEYSVRFMGQKSDKILINLMTTEQLEILTTLNEIEVENEVNLLRVEAKLMNTSGDNLSNHPGLITTFIIKSGDKETEYPAALQNDVFMVEIPINLTDELTIKVVTGTKRFQIESDPISYTPQKRPQYSIDNMLNANINKSHLGLVIIIIALLFAVLVFILRKRRSPIFDASTQVYLRLDCDVHVPPRTINFIRDNPFGLSKFKLEPFVSDSLIRADQTSLLMKMKNKLNKIVFKPTRSGRLRVFIPKDVRLNQSKVTKSKWIDMVEKPQISVSFDDDPNENVTLTIEFI